MNAPRKIRRAQPGDRRLLVRWLEAAGLPTGDLTDAHMRRFLVMDDAETPLGMIGLECFGTAGLLRSLVVEPTARSAGVGRELVAALEQDAQREGVTELWLLTIDADGWFKKLGYTPSPRAAAPEAIRSTREFSGLCPDDAVLMRKAL